jgi:hypothetical protein
MGDYGSNLKTKLGVIAVDDNKESTTDFQGNVRRTS